MKYCKHCLSMDTRYGLKLNDEGICGGCEYFNDMANIDWNVRKQELSIILEQAKEKAKRANALYDCIIGVSGGKDSTFIACYLKENFDIRILLVNCPPQNITPEGVHNLNNLRQQGFDLLQYSFHPDTAKKLSLHAFEKYGHICMPYEHAMSSTVVRMAINMHIPLVVMGENPALAWGTTHTLPNDDWFQAIHNNTNSGILNENTWNIPLINKDNLALYTFPKISEIEKNDLRAIYLQYYVREYSPVYNADFSIARGMKGRYRDALEDIGRYRIFSSIDDDLMIPNEMLKYLKNGFGRASDDAVVDLREGRLSKTEAIKMIQKYDGLCGKKYIDYCCEYLGIDEYYFWQVVDKFVNKNLFEKDGKGFWKPKFTVGEDFEY